MKNIVNIPVASGLLLFSIFSAHIQAEDIQMQSTPILQNIILLPASTNISVKALLLHMARASSVPMNVEIHRLNESVEQDTQPVGSWNSRSSTISNVLSETKRRIPSFSWQASEHTINLILKDPSLTEDVFLSQLKEDYSFSGSQMELIIWLGQVFPRVPINYRETGGVATKAYTIDFKTGTSLRQILNSYAFLAEEVWVANVGYTSESTGDSDYKVTAELSFIRKGNVRGQEVFK